MASNKVSCKDQVLIEPELQIFNLFYKKSKSAYVFLVIIVIFETHIMLFIKKIHLYVIVQRVHFIYIETIFFSISSTVG